VETIRWLREGGRKKRECGKKKRKERKKELCVDLFMAKQVRFIIISIIIIILQWNSNSRMDLFYAWLTLGLGTVGYCMNE